MIWCRLQQLKAIGLYISIAYISIEARNNLKQKMMIYLEEKNSEPEMKNIHNDGICVCVYSNLIRDVELSSEVNKFVKEKGQVK